MKNIQAIVVICTLLLTIFSETSLALSARKRARRFPTIEAYWLNKADGSRHRLVSSRLGEYPTFGLNLSSFDSYKIPQEGLTYAHEQATADLKEKTISQEKLNYIIEQTIKEVNQQKKKFTHATILQNKNFNRKRGCGLLVLQLKEYPFVVKLFKESPKSIVNPYCKGIEPICFFYMGNGANRHLAGLTRLKNRDIVAHKLKQLPQWKDIVEVPRKWLWLPKNPDLIAMDGYNFGPKKKQLKTVLPGTYAIIADAITSNEMPHLLISKKKETVMKLCNDLNSLIDPHFKNFIFYQNPDMDHLKIVIIDTEHFPTMVGLSERKQFKNHNEYYLYLTGKCFHDAYLQNRANDLAAEKQRTEFLDELFNVAVTS